MVARLTALLLYLVFSLAILVQTGYGDFDDFNLEDVLKETSSVKQRWDHITTTTTRRPGTTRAPSNPMELDGFDLEDALYDQKKSQVQEKEEVGQRRISKISWEAGDTNLRRIKVELCIRRIVLFCFVFFHMDTTKEEDVGEENRTVVCQGAAVIRRGWKRKKRYLTLFNDILVVSSKLSMEQTIWWYFFLQRSIREAKKHNITELPMQIFTEDIACCDTVCEYKTKTNILCS
eukprot:XP_008759292.1 PREDICTED: uncharacterized protein LOC103691573 isoform X2 [Rattus norvegicus]